MKQKTTFILILLSAGCMGSHAQTLKYTYDLSGNCTVREYKAPGVRSATEDAAESELLFSTGESSIRIYPNPNRGQFSVELTGYNREDLSKATIAIYSATGSSVFKTESLQPLHPIDLTSQPAGIYVLQVTIGGKSVSHRVIIAR